MPTPPWYDEKANLLINWTKRKIRTHFTSTSDKFFSEGEIWWASLGENIGSEMNGKHDVFERPVVILRKLSVSILLVVPVTTKLKEGSWFFPFHFDGSPRRAVLSQIRVISNHRLVRKMGFMEPTEYSELQDALIAVIIKRNPDFRQGSSDLQASRSRSQPSDDVVEG